MRALFLYMHVSLVAYGLLSGVLNADTPRLRGLVEVNDPTQVPKRNILTNWPRIPEFPGSKASQVENPKYVVQPNDIIELTLEPSNLTIRNFNLGAHGSTDKNLIQNSSGMRIPFSLMTNNALTAGMGLTISVAETDPVVQGTIVTSGITPGKSNWEQVRALFTAVDLPVGSIHYTLRPRLIPSMSRFALPNTAVRITRFYQSPNDQIQTRVPVVEQFTTQVDADGYIWIPPLGSAVVPPGSEFPTLTGIGSSELNKLIGQVDGSSFRVQTVSFPDSRPRSLAEIAGELSSITTKPEPDDIRRWHKIGIDERMLPASGMKVRYMLEVIDDPKWFLVDEDGNRYSLPLSGRALLLDELISGYRRSKGIELLRRSENVGMAYLTVIPADVGSDAEPCFFGRTDYGDVYCDLKHISIQPGDTIIISRQRPVQRVDSLP